MGLLTPISYNCFITFRKEGKFFEEEIDYLLDLLKASENSFNLIKLLFMKAYICKVRNDIDAYDYFYNIAHHYGMFLYSKQELDKIEKDIL